MLLTNLYYQLRPFVPRAIQIAIRRQIVRHRLPKYAHVWPIDEKAGVVPEGWQGWPEGKKFAFVITHDVEAAKGVERVEKLAQIDKAYGVRSSFNFVAEGYRIPEGLREGLAADGFEIGLHGLVHRGNLYGSREKFEQDTVKINKYLKEWNAKGFRTPSMFHNLEWLKDLDIEYDSSTFDTDPFEPQPDALATIFPRWVNRNGSGTGFVELPYTLPQDYMLFVVMKETKIDTWKRKLAWIAERGGMALLLVHPDYINFDNRLTNSEYPANYYTEFLKHISSQYAGQYWHAQPRDVSRFWSNIIMHEHHEGSSANQLIGSSVDQLTSPPSYSVTQLLSRTRSTSQPITQSTGQRFPSVSRRPLRVCMLSYSQYDVDARVTRYAETLARRGDHVDVFALGEKGQERFGVRNGVNVYRIQEREHNEKRKLDFLLKILKFFVKSSIMLSKRHGREPYDLIHVHSVPDFEVFAAWLSKLKGAKLILDIHDIVPEFYASKFNTGTNSFLYKLLVLIEKLSAGFADHVIISNDIWANTLCRSVSNGKCSVIMNYPDPTIFYPRDKYRKNGKFVMVYPGTLNWHQGIDIAIGAFALTKDDIPNAELHVYGRGGMRDQLLQMITELGLQDRVFLKEMLPKEEIAEVMSQADLGIVPKRNDPFGGEAFSTKTLEFMSLGVPIVVAATKIDKYYFNDSVVRFFEAGNEADLARCMVAMAKDDQHRCTQTANAAKFAEEWSWENKKHLYLDLVDRLAGSG